VTSKTIRFTRSLIIGVGGDIAGGDRYLERGPDTSALASATQTVSRESTVTERSRGALVTVCACLVVMRVNDDNSNER